MTTYMDATTAGQPEHARDASARGVWPAPLATLLAAVLLAWLTAGRSAAAGPAALLLLPIFIGAYRSGLPSGLTSAAIVFGFHLWHWLGVSGGGRPGGLAVLLAGGVVAPLAAVAAGDALGRIVASEQAARSRAEGALRVESETLAMLDAMLASAPVAMCFVDRELRFVRVNEAQARINGRSVAAHIGEPLREVWRRGADQLAARFERVFETGEPILDLPLSDELSAGADRHVVANFFPVRDATGQVRYVGCVATDVTERVRAELDRAAIVEALEESEARFRALAASGVLGVLVADPERILEANDAFLQLIGYSREEMLRGEIRWSEVTPPEYADADLRAIETLLRTGVCPPFEKEYIRKDGSRVPIVIGAAITQREPLEWACFVLDDTERWSAREALARRDAELGLVIDTIPARISYIGADGRYRFVNRAYEAWYRRPAASLLGQSLRDTIGETLYARVRSYVDRALAGESVAYEVELLDSGGNLRIVDARYTPDRAPDGTVRGFVALVTDVTERIQAERERRHFALLVEASRDFIAFTALDGTLRYLNPAGRALVGLDDGAPIEPLHIDSCWSPETREVAAEAAALVRAGGTGEFGGRLEAPGGGTIEVAVTVFALPDPRFSAPPTLAWVARDVRAQRRAEANLLRAQRIESTGLLAGGIAHNFNNMLMAVLGYNEYILRGLPPDSALRRDAEEVRRAAGRATELTRQLLAFSQRQVLREEALELNLVVAEIQRMLTPLLGAHIELVTRLQQGLGRVRADRAQLEQVIVNLALNARDAMPTGGRLTIETDEATLDGDYAESHPGTAIPPGEYVRLSVSDTGHGIDAAARARLFEPFFTTKGPGRGTGLGLAMVYGTVKQSGGFVWVYSEPGLGATFKIYLPRSRQPAALRTGGTEVTPVVGGHETVLLVEDEAAVRTLATRALEGEGYTVLAANDGFEALRLLDVHQGALDLLLTDIVMPGMGGKDVAGRVLARYPRTPVIYMSGYTADDLVTRGLREAGTAFVQKPFLPDHLLRLVRQALDERIDA